MKSHQIMGRLTVMALLAAPCVYGNVYYYDWVGGTGNWSVASNWNPANIPRDSFQDGGQPFQQYYMSVTIPNVTDQVTLDASVYPYMEVTTLVNRGTINVTNAPGGINGLQIGTVPFGASFNLVNYGTMTFQNGAYLALDTAPNSATFPNYSNILNFSGNNSSLLLGGQGTTPTLNGLNGQPSTINFTNGTGMEIRGLDGNNSGGRITFTNLGDLNFSAAGATIDNLDVTANSLNATNGSTVTVNGNAAFKGAISVDGTSQVNIHGPWSGYSGGTLTGGITLGGTLEIDGVNVTNATGPINISGAGKLIDQNGNNGFANLATVSGGLNLSNGANVSLPTLTSLGEFSVTGGSTLTSNVTTLTFANAPNNNYPGYPSVIDNSTLSLPNATSILMGGGPLGSYPPEVDFQNGATLVAPNLTAITGGDGTLVVNGSSLSLPSAFAHLGVLTVENGSLTLGGSWINYYLNVGANQAYGIGPYGGATGPATFTSTGFWGAETVNVGLNSTADFRGGADLEVNGGVYGGRLTDGGTYIYDSRFGGAGQTINEIGVGSGIDLVGPNAQVLSWDGTSLHNAIGSIGLVSGYLGVQGGASLALDGKLIVSGTLEVGGLPAGIGHPQEGWGNPGGSYLSIGMDVIGSLIIDSGGHVDITGLAADDGVFSNLIGGTLEYGTFSIAGSFDYHGAPITQIGNNASLTLIGTDWSITHHTTPGPGLGMLSDVEGSLTLQGGATLTTGASLYDNGSIVVDSTSTLITNGFSFGSSGSLYLQGTLESTGGLIDFAGGFVTLDGTVIGMISGDVDNNSNVSLIGGATGNVSNEDGASMTVQGTVGGSLYNDGTLTTGDAPGEATVASYFQDTDGVLNMELDGYQQGTQYDFLNITGAAHFDGTLNVFFGGSTLEDPGAIFNLIQWGSWDGSEFAQIYLPQLDPGFQWVEEWNANGFSIEVESTNATPEPVTYGLVGIALLLCARFRKKC